MNFSFGVHIHPHPCLSQSQVNKAENVAEQSHEVPWPHVIHTCVTQLFVTVGYKRMYVGLR